ncbi:MAG: CRISPR-associated protein Csx3, partial [Cyanobacteria bacterium J06627_28]
ASQTDAIAVGEELSVALNRTPCPTILIGGPPNSGKSVFSNALRVAIKQKHPDKRVYLHRASWDGEGNWVYEAGAPEQQLDGSQPSRRELINRLVTLNEFRIHEDPETAKLIPGYFRYHAGAVKNLRQLTDCLIVDVGGLPQIEKRPLLEQCSHYIVISRLSEAIDAWHQLCGTDLVPLAVIHSVLEPQQKILKAEPLEVIAGPWIDAENAVVPEHLLQAVASLF